MLRTSVETNSINLCFIFIIRTHIAAVKVRCRHVVIIFIISIWKFDFHFIHILLDKTLCRFVEWVSLRRAGFSEIFVNQLPYRSKIEFSICLFLCHISIVNIQFTSGRVGERTTCVSCRHRRTVIFLVRVATQSIPKKRRKKIPQGWLPCGTRISINDLPTY